MPFRVRISNDSATIGDEIAVREIDRATGLPEGESYRVIPAGCETSLIIHDGNAFVVCEVSKGNRVEYRGESGDAIRRIE